jgi:hypothetical protein
MTMSTRSLHPFQYVLLVQQPNFKKAFVSSVFAALAAFAMPSRAQASIAAQAVRSSSDTSHQLPAFAVQAKKVSGDLMAYHYRITTDDGDYLDIHRVVRVSPHGKPHKSDDAVMLLHGDFSTFVSNFAPSIASEGAHDPQTPELALALAKANIDVWGLDRRFTHVPDDAADLSALDRQGVVSGLDDLQSALAFARRMRRTTMRSNAKLKVIGFSRGGLYAYAQAIGDHFRPRRQRHVGGVAVLDFNYVFGPEDAALKEEACAIRDFYDEWIAEGNYGESNFFLREVAQAAIDLPELPSDVDPTLTNRQYFLSVMAQTYQFFAPTPHYHLLAGDGSQSTVNELTYTSTQAAMHWVAQAPGWAPAREGRDSFAILCDDGNGPIEGTLGDIDVPALQIGVAGGYGDLVSASVDGVIHADSDFYFWERESQEDRLIDVGHADLLFSQQAKKDVWPVLKAWIKEH